MLRLILVLKMWYTTIIVISLSLVIYYLYISIAIISVFIYNYWVIFKYFIYVDVWFWSWWGIWFFISLCIYVHVWLFSRLLWVFGLWFNAWIVIVGLLWSLFMFFWDVVCVFPYIALMVVSLIRTFASIL